MKRRKAIKKRLALQRRLRAKISLAGSNVDAETQVRVRSLRCALRVRA